MKKGDENGETANVITKTLSIEEFCKIATPEQNELLSEIYDAVEKEIEIAEKINAIYKSISTGIYCAGHCAGEAVTVCESEDDANAISIELKVELSEVRSRIGTLLKKAIDELDMGNVGIIKRQYDNYVK